MRRACGTPLAAVLLLLVAGTRWTGASELTFELPDNERMCFHEIIDAGVKCTLEFQVGGQKELRDEICATKE